MTSKESPKSSASLASTAKFKPYRKAGYEIHGASSLNDVIHPDTRGEVRAYIEREAGCIAAAHAVHAGQLATFEELIQWLHDYNLQRREKPNFSPEILRQLTLFEAVRNSQEPSDAGQGS